MSSPVPISLVAQGETPMKTKSAIASVTIVAMLGLAVAGTQALAHMDGGHKPNAASVVKEQKDWGIAGSAKAARRTVRVTLTDNMRFTPDRLEVRQGETIRIVLANEGKLLHEFVLGTRKELDAHAALMVKFPGMQHDEPYMAHVSPGKTGEIVWTFNRAGEFDFACLINGHYQAGMVGKVNVTAAATSSAPRK
jgi:uncharacterized cupredoxin-like copper-binding protein